MLAPLPTSFRLIPALHFHHPPHQFRAPPSLKLFATPEIYITIHVIQVLAPSHPIPYLCQVFVQGTTKSLNLCSEVNQFTSNRSLSSTNPLTLWAHQLWVACHLSTPFLTWTRNTNSSPTSLNIPPTNPPPTLATKGSDSI